MRVRTEPGVKAVPQAKAVPFRWTEALKQRLRDHVLAGINGVTLQQRPDLTGFHRTRLRVMPLTIGTRTTYAWYNPSTGQVLSQTLSTSRLQKTPTT